MLACGTLSNSSRQEQLKYWESSDTNKEVAMPRSAGRVKFPIDVQFHAACSNSELNEVKELLSKGVDINVANIDGLTVLHQACIDNNYEVVQFLLLNGANVNAQDNEGWTPLHACASCSYTELAKLLVERGANVGIVSFEMELPLDVAQGVDMVAFLKGCMQRQSIDGKAARGAEEQVMLCDAREWLQSGEYPRIVDPRTGATALHIAAAKGYSEVVELLLKLPDVEVDAADLDGWTSLHAAAHWAKETPLRLLAAAGASFDAITLTNQSIFDVADRSVTMLLRQLRETQRIEQQRRVADMGSVHSASSSAARRKSEEEPVSSGVDKDQKDEAKPVAPKQAKRTAATDVSVGLKEPEREKSISVASPSQPPLPEIADTREAEAHPTAPETGSRSSAPLAASVKVEAAGKPTEQKTSPSHPSSKVPQTPEKSIEVPKYTALTSSPTPCFAAVAEIATPPSAAPVAAAPTSVDLAKPVETPRLPSAVSTSMSPKNQAADATSTGGEAGVSPACGTSRRISAVLAPARSDETEAQRSSKARMVRSTRRSTQGIAADVLEEARRLSAGGGAGGDEKKEVAVAREKIADATKSTSTPAANPLQKPMPRDQAPSKMVEEEESVHKVDLANALNTCVSKATVNPAQTDASPASASATAATVNSTSAAGVTAPQSETTSSSADGGIASSGGGSQVRARRMARDRVPTGRLNASDVVAAARQIEQSASAVDETSNDASSTGATIPRPTTRVLHSAPLNSNGVSAHVATINGGGGVGRERQQPSPSPLHYSPFASSAAGGTTRGSQHQQTTTSNSSKIADTRFNRREALDYRRLYEEERSEKERLKRSLEEVTNDVTVLRSELARLHETTFDRRGHTGSSDPSSASVQSCFVDFLEKQAKEIDRLRQENSKMADENKSLVRVIGKLTRKNS